MRTIRTDRNLKETNKSWSAKDKARAVGAWLSLGNMSRVEEQTGIPVGTLNYWKTQPWWFELIERVRAEEDQILDDTFTKIVKKTQSIILDRLENGDIVLDKYGKPVSKPVSMRDAAIVNAIAVDKRKVLRDKETGGETKVGMQERLKNLEIEFSKLANKKKPNIIDAEIIEENGEEELQEGVCDRVDGEAPSSITTESSETDTDQEGSGACGGRERCGPQESHFQRGLELSSESGNADPQ